MIFLLSLYMQQVSAKVRFLTFHYDKPEFIDIQYKTFKKFMLDDYELIVFNDAKDPAIEKSIQETCDKYGIQCIRFNQEWHEEAPLNYKIAEWLKDPKIFNPHTFISPNPRDIGKQPSVRHCHVIKYAMENFGYNHDDIVGLVDGDAFPIRPLSVRSLLSDCDIAGIRKNYYPIEYLWVVFMVFDMRSFPNKKDLIFDLAVVDNMIHDTGSNLYHFLLDNPHIRCKKYDGLTGNNFPDKSVDALLSAGFSEPEIDLIQKENTKIPVEFHLDKRLLHFSTSSFNFSGHVEKLALVKDFAEKILADGPYPKEQEKPLDPIGNHMANLLNKIKENPNHPENLFQLALAYDAEHNNEEAIKWFQARIDKGGDKVEVWGSMYKLGEIYNSMGLWNQALEWYQKAFQEFPERAEPLLKLAQHYRVRSQHNLAYLYANQGASIPRPPENSLFYSPDVYDYLFDEDLSIAAYYTSFSEEGRKAADRLILNRGVPGALKDQTYKNMIFYAPVLKEAKIEAIKIVLPPIREGMTDTYSPMNSSIQKIPGGYRILCRTVNYIRNGISNFTLKEPDCISKTRNFLIDYDLDFNVISQKEIVEQFPRIWISSRWEGLEDCRLFANGQNPSWFTCATIGTHPNTIGQSLCKLSSDHSGSTILVDQLIPLKSPEEWRCEKNWLPFIKEGQLHMIYSYDPFVIYKVDQQSGDLETVIHEKPARDMSRFRGSAAPIEWGEGYLLVIHEVIPDHDKLFYMHRFMQLDKDLKITSLSKPFFFKQKGLEYCCGMTLDHSGKNLLLTIGVDDREAYLVTIDLAHVKSLLEPIGG